MEEDPEGSHYSGYADKEAHSWQREQRGGRPAGVQSPRPAWDQGQEGGLSSARAGCGLQPVGGSIPFCVSGKLFDLII